MDYQRIHEEYLEKHPEKYEEQIALEKGMKQKGIDRYKKEVARKQHYGEEETTSYGRQLLTHTAQKLSDRIAEKITEVSQKKAGRSFSAIPLVRDVNPDILAFFTLKCAFGSLTRVTPLSSVVIRIGVLVEDELKSYSLKEADKHS